MKNIVVLLEKAFVKKGIEHGRLEFKRWIT